ncbi:MAG: hypothetical protein ACI9MC_002319 [Kiritimatiellia bacterium]|jgi:hypothetical protein
MDPLRSLDGHDYRAHHGATSERCHRHDLPHGLPAKITKAICEQYSDYIIAVKNDQAKLAVFIEEWFDEAQARDFSTHKRSLPA